MKLQSVILQMKVREKYFSVLLFKHKQCSHNANANVNTKASAFDKLLMETKAQGIPCVHV